ncbi:ATP-dependent DNA helicase DDX11 [Pseudolycoriella hygida]|uniref:ATP-dependent DNA helicase DDX11 n=1 Tax=Pseudolycoriella hygida TaxID=35572 RepID=A0A9Q0RUS3_9DIPT|nr:ATP-dependent DNA helicase DDX11 [Pseudolycoriella hygida]
MTQYEPSTPLSTPSQFDFPFPPYDIQQDFMANLYSVLENKQIGIFESPTGTGKSLSLTCGALRWLCDHEKLRQQQLIEDIDKLAATIRDEEKSNEVNWLESQHEVILKKESLMKLRKVLERLSVHDKEMIAIKERRTKERKAKVKYRSARVSESIGMNDEQGEDDEFLITNSDDDGDENDAEDDNRYPGVQIFFCSRTHSQLTQVVNAIKSTVYGKSIRVASLASRQNYCINDDVRKLNSNSLINDRCLELQRPSNSQPTKLCESRAVKKKKTEATRCPFYSKQTIDTLREESLVDIMDIEDLVKVARSEKACPYYSSRLAAKDAQVVMIPYQILLHKRTRVQSGLCLTNNIVIVDEAHNLIDSLTSVYSAEISLTQLQASREQLDAYKTKYSLRFSSKNLLKINQLIFVTKQLIKLLSADANKSSTRMITGYDLMVEGEFFNIKINDILDFCDKTRLPQKVQGFSQKFGTTIVSTVVPAPKLDAKSFLKQLAEKQSNEKKKIESKTTPSATESPKGNDAVVSSSIRLLLKFLECLVENIDDGRVLLSYNVSVRSKSSMKYVLLNPSGHFNDILKECRSVIVAGGTMQPTSEFKNQLFPSYRDRVKEFSFQHVVPTENVLPLVVSTGPSGTKFSFNFTNRLNKEMLNDLSSTLRNVCNVVPGGVVCFFSSYDYLETFYSYLEEVNGLNDIRKKKFIFKEPRLSGQVEKMLADYATAVKSKELNGAILFSVVGGKLSEGMNFSDDLARCVIVIGMPFPNKTSPELVEKMSYLDREFGSGAGAEYYENICMKSVNQCIGKSEANCRTEYLFLIVVVLGRAVRHIKDYAAVLLVDERYSQRKIIEKLPRWISNSLQCTKRFGVVQSSLVCFFRRRLV